MVGFVTGFIAGGAVVWLWGDRLRRLAHDKTDRVRDTVARGLESVQTTAEGALDTAKEQIRTGLQAGQDYLRSDNKRSTTTYR